MRPDEHKKKKNAAYKKSHGISSKDKESEPSSKEKKNTEKGKPKAKTDKEPSSSQHHSPNQHVSNKEGRSELEMGGATPNTKTFSRRQIVSNWGKYDLEPDLQAEASMMGGNYKDLINAAGEAMARFKFSDELDWDVSASSEEAPAQDDTKSSSILCIDPVELEQSLACLPLHTVLGLPPDMFPENELNQCNERARENMTLYSKDMKSIISNNNNQLCISKQLNKCSESGSMSKSQDSGGIMVHKDKQTDALSETKDSNDKNAELNVNKTVRDKPTDIQNNLAPNIMSSAEKPLVDKHQRHEMNKDINSDKTSAAVSQEQKEELEDWLDSILD